MQPPINIYSGETGLGAALTNPTAMARSKGGLAKNYPIVFQGKHWPDVESAYLTLAQGNETAESRDRLMTELIAAKFRQHPDLLAEVVERGGHDWLSLCSHLTGAKSERFQKWEGMGLESRFIRNLVAGFDAAYEPPTEQGQSQLF